MTSKRMTPSRRDVLLTTAAAAAASALPARAANHAENYELIPLRDGIWRTRDTNHSGLLVDSDSGILIFDTLNSDFSEWLNAEVANRFNKPVSWVVYSHNHADHVSGGQAFAGHNPRYISQRLARESMSRMSIDTHLPDETFDSRFDIDLGNRRVELRYHGPNDGRGSISLLVPDQKVLSAVDWLLIGRAPWRDLSRYNVEGTIASLHDIDRLDWDMAAPGHADVGDKAGMRILRDYYETVRDSAIDSLVKGETVDVLVPVLQAQLAAVPEFAALAQFENWSEANIRDIHRQIAHVEGLSSG